MSGRWWNGYRFRSFNACRTPGPVAEEEITLLQLPADADRFSRVPDGAVTTDSNGRFIVRGVSPDKRTVYRARFSGNEAEGLEPSVSSPQTVPGLTQERRATFKAWNLRSWITANICSLAKSTTL